MKDEKRGAPWKGKLMSQVSGPRAVHLRDKRPAETQDKPSSTARKGFRGDLEGLRALAVVAVIAEHLTGFPRGGFVGVDVFFVLSGFLITGIMLREYAATGGVSFSDFYRRRIRRILPVATLVLVVTVAASYGVFRAARANAIFHDALWAALFAGNWQQAISGNDYMAAGSSKSPLEHFWSLGVEEQFYLLWPVVLTLLLWLSAKAQVRGQARVRLVAAGLTLLVIASFAYSVWQSATNPAVAYFDTFGRAWELGAGALLAAFMVLLPRLERLTLGLRFILAVVGLGAIVLSMIVFGPNTTFPGPWALLPVLGTLAVIMAGAGKPGLHYLRGIGILTNPATRYLGRISFSLYLWHFPVIIIFQALMPHGGAPFYVLTIALTLGLSWLSYRYVEDPVRRSRWLESSYDGAGRRFAQPNKGPSRAVGLGVFAAVVLLVATGMIVSSTRAVEPPVASNGFSKIALPTPASRQTPSPTTPGSALSVLASPGAQSAQTEMIRSALATKKWPALNPGLDQFSDDGAAVKAPQWIKDGCLGGQPTAKSSNLEENTSDCVFGDPHGTHTLIVYGDSVAISYVPGILEAVKGQGWKVRVLTVAGCPVAEVDQTSIGGAPFPECNTFRDWAIGQINQSGADLVVVSEFRNDLVLTSKHTGAPADAERAAGYQKTLTKLARIDVPMLFLPAPPEGKILASCATTLSTPADCQAETTPLYQRNLGIQKVSVAGYAGPRALLVDTTAWFCEANICPAFIGTTPMHADEFHLTAAGSQELAPLLADSINRALAK